MTRDEALQEIGVPPGSSPEEIRRAYLRKTRTWNPAADPDGLRRLREAHDLLLGASPAQASPAPPPRTYSAAPQYPAAPSFQPAAPFYEPPREPVDSWASRAPEPAPDSSGRRWLFIFGGGLAVLLVLWFWLSRFQGANDPSTEPLTLHPAIMPPAPGYESARQGLADLCTGRKRDDFFCDTAEAILDATEQHKCSDARDLHKRIARVFNRQERHIDPALELKVDAFGELLDEEMKRCWKFWNP